MQFAFMTEPQAGGTYDELLRLASWAESVGFDSFTRSDHFLNGDVSVPTTDALTTFAGLARDTQSIRLTVLVTPITFRHPAVIAKTAATIDEMSHGRLELGVGTGWMESEHEAFGMDLPPLRDRFSLFYETLAYLQAALGDGATSYKGRHFRLDEIEVLPGRTGPLPLIVGGGGNRKTPTFAGRFADEYNMFSCDRDTQMARTKVMHEAASDVGRDPSEITISFVGYPVIGDNDAEVNDVLGARAADRGMERDQYRKLLDGRSIPVGTPDQVATAFDELESRGIDRYYLQVFAPLGEIDTAEVERTLRVARGN